MRKIIFFFLACFVTQHISAQLLNSVVNVSPYFPSNEKLVNDAGDVTVSAAIEYPEGSYFRYNPAFQVDITDTQIIIISGNTTVFAEATFNGWILEPVSGVKITEATLDPGSDLSPTVNLQDGRVEINFAGIAGNGFSTTTINVSSELSLIHI